MIDPIWQHIVAQDITRQVFDPRLHQAEVIQTVKPEGQLLDSGLISRAGRFENHLMVFASIPGQKSDVVTPRGSGIRLNHAKSLNIKRCHPIKVFYVQTYMAERPGRGYIVDSFRRHTDVPDLGYDRLF